MLEITLDFNEKHTFFGKAIVKNKKYTKKHPGDITIIRSNIRREKNIFNHEIKVSLKRGIEKLINWHRSYYK